MIGEIHKSPSYCFPLTGQIDNPTTN